MTKRRSPSHTTIGHEIDRERADLVIAEDRAIVQRTGGKVSEEDYQDALLRLASGEQMKSVTERLGLSRNALLVRANRDEEFNRMLDIAHQMGAWARIENAERMLLDSDTSVGAVRKATAYADFVKWLAPRLHRERFGDKLQVDQRMVTINLPDWAKHV